MKISAARLVGWGIIAGLLALFAVNLVWVAHHVDSLRPVGKGTLAPPVDRPLLGGGRFVLRPGRVTVIDFWATWCPPCREELPTLDALARKLAGRADVVALNVEPPEVAPKVAAFVKQTGLTLPVALDGEAASEAYHVEALPHVVVIDARGTVRRVFVGPASAADLDQAVREAE